MPCIQRYLQKQVKKNDQRSVEISEQAGAELGQAQLKLGLELTSILIILVLLYLLSRPTFTFTLI